MNMHPSTAKPLLTTALLCLLLCQPARAEQTLRAVVIEQKPHDPTLFTQGLILHGGDLYESSGLYGKSFIRRYDAQTQEIKNELALPAHYFAEGLTLFDQQLIVLTWKAGRALVYDPHSFAFKGQRSYAGDGWGLTHNGSELITSDGSATLYFRDATTFTVKRTLQVRNKWRKYRHLNELEYAASYIWANVWQSPLILKIAPHTGEVVALANLRDLVRQNSARPGHSVLNGIAYDAERDAFWITGKLWPRRYLVRFAAPSATVNRKTQARQSTAR